MKDFKMNIIFIGLSTCAFTTFVYANIDNAQSLGQCLRNKKGARLGTSLMTCAGNKALHTLQVWEDADNFSLIEGLKIVRDEKASRTFENFLDKDPMDFRGILEGASAIISKRSMEWDMSTIHPGLMLRISPSSNGPGLLEFVMDSNQDRDIYENLEREPSTARVLTRQFLVPLLLGLKFNLATILPLVFGILILISKKAIFICKMAVIISSAFGFGGLFSSTGLSNQFGDHGHGSGLYGYDSLGYPGHHHHYSGGHHHYKNYKQFDNVEETKTTTPRAVDNFYKYEDQLHFRDRLDRLYNKDQYTSSNRQFGWQMLTPK